MYLEWRLQALLQREGVTPYRLAKEAGISTQNLYPLVRGEVTAIRAETLVRIINALARLTGRTHSVQDILEVVPVPHMDQPSAEVRA